MGKGGQIAGATSAQLSQQSKVAPSEEKNVWQSPYKPLDSNAPALPSKGEIKAVIPKHCFDRSFIRSMGYVVRDTILAAGCVYLTLLTGVTTDLPSNWLSVDALIWVAVWNLYAFWMGTILTGHWVLAHECGHGAFSSSQTANDIVGFILHHALLVPYHPWQYTHAKHHRRTNHLLDGESHVPSVAAENGISATGEREGSWSVIHEAMGDGAFAILEVLMHLAIGWPVYLMGLASTGKLGQDGKPLGGDIADHYRPYSRMFPSKFRWKVWLSTVTIVASLGLLTKLSLEFGFLTIWLWYGGAYMWTNAWLVLYTWLQHTDPSVPHYGSAEWTWVRGALSTIDRPYGIFDFFHHKIGSTHVAHHLFHEMPFYKADEATAAIKAFLEPKGLYNYDPTPWYKAMWRIALTCHYVDKSEGIQYFKSFGDLPSSSKRKAA